MNLTPAAAWWSSPPGDWTRHQWETFDIKTAPAFSCRACRKADAREVLEDDWDGDDYRSWQLFTWRCTRCDCAWEMRLDRIAPDWADRVN